MSDIRVGFAHRDIKYSAGCMPVLMDRLKKFCADIETDTDPDKLIEWVWRLYATRDPRWGLWFLVHETDGIIGHLLAHIDPFDEVPPKSGVLIRQAMSDPKYDTRLETIKVFDSVDKWCRHLGVTQQTIVTDRDTMAMYRRWGFVPYKTIMRRAV